MKYFSIHILKSFFILLFCFIVFIALNESQNTKIIYISENDDPAVFINTLQSENIVLNRFSRLFIETYIKLRGGIEPGGYEINSKMGAVATILTLNKPQYRYVSIYDGFRKAEISERIGKQLNWSQEQIKDFAHIPDLCPLYGVEGFFASGTYLIHVKEDVDIIEQTMLQVFQDTLRELNLAEDSVSLHQIIILASLIQREAAGIGDMRLISGIIHNRLKIDMPLQIDATLQYIKGDQNNWWPVPRPQDKIIDSPFNTYLNIGLPPLPIATPSKDAIYAALNPLETDCLYYLHDKRGVIHCATTYDQHRQNIRNYLR